MLGLFIFNCTRAHSHVRVWTPTINQQSDKTQLQEEACERRENMWELHRDDKETKSLRGPDSRVHATVYGLLCNCAAQFLASCSP